MTKFLNSKTDPTPQISPPLQNPLVVFEQEDISKKLKKFKSSEEIRIVYFGTTEFSAYILEKLFEYFQNPAQTLILYPGGAGTNLKFIIQSVVTTPDRPVGRTQQLTPSPVSLVAQKHKLPTLKPEKLDQDFLRNHQVFLEAELFVVIFYGKIIPQIILDLPNLGAINVHPSLLPNYRGASPVQAAILNGDKETGVTIIKMDEKMDHGPILSVAKLSISDEDNTQTLSNKTTQLAFKELLKLLPKFAQGQTPSTAQDETKATYCHVFKKEDGYFDINNPPTPEILDRMIRAYYPWSNAWTKWNEKIIKFLPGGMVQMEGKKAVKLADFLNGYPNFPIKQL